MSEVKDPTKVISWEDFFTTTDNANKLMDRVWYCIASTDKSAGNQTVFWEHWYWKDGKKSTGVDLNKKIGQNHTKLIDESGKETDFPIWPVKFSNKGNSKKSFFKMSPAIDLKCTVIAPFAVKMQPVQFPSDGSRTEFRVDYFKAAGKKMYFIFVLDPLISENDKANGFKRLEEENGVLREWFSEVKWAEDYKIGATDEPDINPK